MTFKIFLIPSRAYQQSLTCDSVGCWILQTFLKASEIALRHTERGSLPGFGRSGEATNSGAQNVQQPVLLSKLVVSPYFQSGQFYSRASNVFFLGYSYGTYCLFAWQLGAFQSQTNNNNNEKKNQTDLGGRTRGSDDTVGGTTSLRTAFLMAMLFFTGISFLALLALKMILHLLSHPLQRCVRQSPSLLGKLLGRQMLQQINYHTVDRLTTTSGESDKVCKGGSAEGGVMSGHVDPALGFEG